MCKVGDIILIYNAQNDKRYIGKHPFVVIDDTNDIVLGTYQYDFIGLLLTSADTDEKKQQRNKEGNFPIAREDKIPDGENNKNAYLESDQFFYFDKSKVKYRRIARLDDDIFELVLEFIQEFVDNGGEIKRIVDKATKIE